MNDRQHVEPDPANPKKSSADKTPRNGDSSAEAATADKAKSVNELSAEEQMALYEKELKETDWGHQPC